MRVRSIALAALMSAGAAEFGRMPHGPHVGVRLSTDRVGHVFLTDEDVRLTVSGAPEGSYLRVTESDAGGRPVGRHESPVTASTIDLGEMPAGWYHVEPDGSPEGSVDLAVARRRADPSFRDDSPYGVVTPPANEKEWELFSQMGAAWVQWSAAWAYLEVQPGVFWFTPGAPKQYANPDTLVEEANKHGVRTVIQFRTVPPWAAKGRIGSFKEAGETRGDTFPPDEEHWDAYDKFVETVVGRFKSQGVHHYEVWAEAEGSLFKNWSTPKFPKVEAYQRLLQHTRKAVKAKDPEGKILGPGDFVPLLREAEQGYTAPAQENRKPNEYAGSSLPGIGKAVDIVSGHFYWTDWQAHPRTHYGPEEINPSRRPTSLKEMIADAQELAGSRPVWISEVGYGSGVSVETPDNIGAADDDEQANLLVRYFLLARAWGVKKMFWYTWKDRPGANGALQSSYGLLRRDGTAKPAYTAYRTMTERTEGLSNIRLYEHGPNRWIVHLTGPKTVVVVWKLRADGKPETLSLPWSKVRVTERDGKSTVETPENGKIHVTLRSGEPVYFDEAP